MCFDEAEFGSLTKHETNTKAHHRLSFEKFLKEVGGSILKAFNYFLLRIDKIAALSTKDQESDRENIFKLLRTIEHTSWFINATAGTDRMLHFTSVVERINHELARMAANYPTSTDPNIKETQTAYAYLEMCFTQWVRTTWSSTNTGIPRTLKRTQMRFSKRLPAHMRVKMSYLKDKNIMKNIQPCSVKGAM